MVDIILIDEINNKWQEYDGIVISPGPGIAIESETLLKFTNSTIKHKPILGICLGHQALSIYFGAKFIPASHIAHGESSPLQFVDPISKIFHGLSQGTHVGRYHSWVMDKKLIPDELRVTAYDDEGNIQAFEHKLLPITGFQFHPESIMTPDGIQMTKNWLDMIS